jgi:fatty acid desaturase
MTLRRGNDQSPVGQVPRRTTRRGGPEEAATCSFLVLILLVIGFIAKIAILWTIGIILPIVGAVLWILGSMGHPVGGRRHYW